MNKLHLSATPKLEQWWKPKASNLLAILYWVMLLTALPFSKALLLFSPSVFTILGIGSFGHFVNDWCDIASDQRAGKNNRLTLLTLQQKWGLLAGALGVALLPWVILPFDGFSILLLCLEFGFLLAYALPPIRLKERKIWPIIADSTYAYALPAVLAAYTFFLAASHSADPYFLGFLFLWQLAYGIRHYLNHLALDRMNDIKTDTHTLATQKGNAFIHQLIRKCVLPIEVVSFVAFLITIGWYYFVLPFVVASLFLFCSFLPFVLSLGRQYSFFTCRFSRTTLDSFYQNGWPFLPLIFLIIRDWRYGLLLFGHALLFYPFFFKGVRQLWSFLFRYGLYLPAIYVFVVPVALFKRRMQNQKHHKAGKKKASALSIDPEKGVANKSRVSIAIANINKSKYTETFINELLPNLKYPIHYLYGGELPQFDADNRHFLSNWSSIQSFTAFLETFLHVEKHYFLRQSISSYLQTKNIQLVLAEFGPVGAQLYTITKDLGIPLLVYFHGYDVYHKETVQQNLSVYQHLFAEAKKIIGVSQSMLDQLQELGAPPEKLVHLPAYVHLDLFPYSDHSSLPPRFLAVGRFAETKSPHLTILAFHRVVQQIPDATLTMIGKDGGGELFEACVILAKSLGIADRVLFKGVLPHKEVAYEMQKARVLVQHSITTPENKDREGKPVVIMEAMACGLPVIATRHSGITELIEENVTGILVNEYDIQAMADAMVLLATNDAAVQRIGQQASASIQHHPLIRNHVKILEALMDECLVQN